MEEEVDWFSDIRQRLTLLDIALDETTDEEEHEALSREQKNLSTKIIITTFVAYEQDGHYGVKLYNGIVAVPPIFDEIRLDEGKTIVLARRGDKWIVLYEHISRINQHVLCDDLLPTNWIGMYLGKKDGLWGIYSTEKGDWELCPEYNEITECGSYFKLRDGDKWGLFAYGIVIPAMYDEIRVCRHPGGYVRFYKDGVLGYIDKAGKWTPDLDKANAWL